MLLNRTYFYSVHRQLRYNELRLLSDIFLLSGNYGIDLFQRLFEQYMFEKQRAKSMTYEAVILDCNTMFRLTSDRLITDAISYITDNYLPKVENLIPMYNCQLKVIIYSNSGTGILRLMS